MNFRDKTAEVFVEELSSKAPVPGGGGASALVGAIGMALGTMVSSLTIGKEKYKEHEEELKKLKEEALGIQDDLLNLIDGDAEGFKPLSEAYGLPKNTEEEKAHREKVMESALEQACVAPMEIMRKTARAIEITEVFAQKGSKLAISDAGVSATVLASALKGAALNIFINTKMLKDREKADKIEKEAQELIDEYATRADNIYHFVKKRL